MAADKTVREITAEIITDPGVGYGAVNSVLFASSTNAFGLGVCLAATGIAVVFKALALIRPVFLEKHAALCGFFYDGRVSLRASAVALLIVGGMAFFNGDLLPAMTSLFFAIADFRLAESVFSAPKQYAGSEMQKMAALAFQRPDLYINAGFAAAGLMAGGAALWIFPVVAISFWVTMQNVLRGRPEYAGHPKIIAAGAALIFAVIGFLSGNFWPAISHIFSASILINVESRITPGGFRQVLRDVTHKRI